MHFITKEVVSKYDEDEHGDPIKNRVSNRYKRFKYQAGDKIEFDVTLCATAVGKMFRVHWRSDSAIGLFEGFDASRPNCYTDAQCYTDVTVTDNKPKVSTKETEDQSPVISITGSAAITEGDTATFTLTAAPKPTTDITVTVDVADSGGFAGSDQIDRRTVIIGIDGTATLSVTTDDDSTDEPDGTLTATVQAGTDYAPSDTAAMATIAVNDNDDPPPGTPVISITGGGAITEGANAEFTLTATPAPSSAITVNVDVVDSGSFAGRDQAGSRTVTIGTSGTTTLSVTTDDDNTDEPDGNLTATVQAGTDYAPSDTAAMATIAVNDNDDPPPGTPVISITGGGAITEGANAEFTLTATPAPSSAITVNVDVVDSGSFAGRDQAGSRTVTIGTSGTTTLSVTTDDDNTDEPDGNLTATVQAGTDYAPSDTAATATITVSDNDVSDSNQPETRSDSGRPAISITDAVGMEGQDLEFPVALDAATRDSVTVEWATEPGTATADVDYMETSGTLTFQPGETTKTISVATIDDDHHDDGEIFKVILSNPTGASISDGEATGTIENADLVPGNWIARFGQVVGELVVRAVQVRMQMPKSTGITGEIGGYALRSNADPEIKDESSTSVTPRNDTSVLKTGYSKRHPHAFGDPEVVPVYVPLDMSMIATRETADGEGLISIWGQGSWSGFKDDDVIDGQATNFLLGIDHRKGRWLTGLAIGRSSGEGGWTGTDDRMGTISMTLSGFYPYLGYSLSDRASIWGVAGYGSGDLKLTTPDDETFKTDATLTMAAAGLRAIIIEGETDKSPTISVLADGMTTRTESDAVPGLGATDGKRTRLRLGLESSWNFTSDNGMITPRTEISLRHDGGDGEDGMGIELGVGVGYQSHDNALTFDFSGRSVAINSNSDFREWSVSTSLMYDPRPNTDRGLAVSLNQSTGTGLAGDVDSLMNTAAAEDFVQQQDPMKSGSLQAEAAYGVPAFGGRMTGAPLVGYSLSDDVRETKIGWRLTPERPKWGSFELATEVTRSDPANDDDSEYALGVQSVMQW
ncbi:MAG: autotransporter domain-containing protein [Rhodobacteraceae bacterium]|nr:autotransporter domain-containing protein [Paracoccaceae bacterium]